MCVNRSKTGAEDSHNQVDKASGSFQQHGWPIWRRHRGELVRAISDSRGAESTAKLQASIRLRPTSARRELRAPENIQGPRSKVQSHVAEWPVSMVHRLAGREIGFPERPATLCQLALTWAVLLRISGKRWERGVGSIDSIKENLRKTEVKASTERNIIGVSDSIQRLARRY